MGLVGNTTGTDGKGVNMRRSLDYWKAIAQHADGTEVIRCYPYHAEGSYLKENEEQYHAECEILSIAQENVSEHGEVVFYTVEFCTMMEE